MTDLQDHDGAGLTGRRDTANPSEHVQQPGQPPNVKLTVGETDHGVQAAVPGVVGELVVDDDLRWLVGDRHPSRIGQRAPVVDPQGQVRAVPGAAAQVVDRPAERLRLAVEGVQQELVVGDLGRHPIELRVDGGHPVRGHNCSESARPWPAANR